MTDIDEHPAAMLAAAAAGYERLMAENQALTHQSWSATRKYVREVAEDHKGRQAAKGSGRLSLAFDSVFDALECAIEAQLFLDEVNADVPEGRGLRLRWGLHLGDPEVAAELAERAEPGSIWVSERVQRIVAVSPLFAFQGPYGQRLAGGGQALAVYRVVPDSWTPTARLGLCQGAQEAGRAHHEPEDGRSGGGKDAERD